MKSAVLLALLALTPTLSVPEAAAQTCREGDCGPCVVGGKRGSRCCENGKLSACIPELSEDPDLCAGKACTGGRVCVNDKCVCDTGFTDCGGTCRDLTADSGNCGACNNICPSGTRCQPSIPVILSGPAGGQIPPTAPAGVCTCLPPTIQCGGVCRNPTNDPSNCGACGHLCTAPTTSCRDSQCVSPDSSPTSGSAGSTGDLPLDLFWSTTDPNGLPFNADWRAHSNPALVEGNHVDVLKACPQCRPSSQCLATCLSAGANSAACRACLPDESCWRQCTKFGTTSDGGLFCGASHINWFPAAYDGRLEFDDYSARGFLSSIVQDDDYTFNLSPTGDAGLAGRNRLHPEMSFLETVDRFHSSFWENFHRLVDQVPGDDLSGPRALFNRYAIVIGLQGLDTQHGPHEELHPIYAMALRRTENPNHSCWAMFARNWGNEGFCSHRDHPLPLPLNRITFRLPQPGATAVTETSRELRTNSTITAVSDVALVQDGAEITFFLGDPSERTQVNGEICLRWAVRPGARPLRVVAAAPGGVAPELDEEEVLGAELLTRAQATQLARSLPAAPKRDKRLDMLVPKRVPFVPVLASSTIAAGPATVGPIDAEKQARERQIHNRICALLRGNPKRPKTCDQP